MPTLRKGDCVMMFVDTYNAIEGFHHYENAPEFCSYLQFRHRHIFVIRCKFKVSKANREIEINQAQSDIEKYINERFGKPCEFGNMSCEMIGQMLLEQYPALEQVQVLEDGYGGATVTR